MEQSPQKPHHEPHSHFLASLTLPIPSSGILKSFLQEQTQGPELQEAPRPRRAMSVLSPQHQKRQHLAQHLDKQEEAAGAAPGPLQ